jgi:hypothetical protein
MLDREQLEQAIEEQVYINFDFAIMSIFATYTFEVSSQIGKTRQVMETSKYWGKNQARLNEGMKGVRRTSKQAVALCLFIIIVTAIGTSLPTRALDERMVLILEGCSLLFAAVVMGMLSFDIGRWTGLYFKIWQAPDQEETHSVEEVKFIVRWSYYRIFARYFFFLMPFYQGTNAITIPLSMIAGICFGVAISVVVFLARRREDKCFQIIVVILISILVLFSSVICGDGVYFIALVWETIDDPDESVWSVASFVICLSVEGLCHVARWVVSLKTKKSMPVEADLRSTLSKENRPRMAASLIFEAMKKPAKSTDSWKAPIKEVSPVNEGSEGHSEPGAARIADDEVNGDVKATIDAICSCSSPESQSLDEPKEYKDPKDQSHDEFNEYKDPDDPVESESEEAKDTNDPDKDVLEGSEKAEEDDGTYETPTYRKMFCSYWTCCGCVRKEHRSEMVWSLFHWSVWWVLVLVSLYLVVVNLGSTAQQENARKKLPYVAERLYNNINEGQVCAFDNKGEKSNITTFKDKETAHALGFLVLHCGACAACSDWDNLRQEYVTRNSLAADSAACAKKSLFGGRDAVLECLKQPPISFQGKCAECWVDDILCTKGFCSFIYMQSLVINTVSNFQVQEDTITSASCEEAHCEAGNPGDFVFCSGATRRRMNVTSSIQRPGAQRCGIVDVDWETLFPE